MKIFTLSVFSRKMLVSLFSLFLIAIFTVGGCNNNSGSDNPDLVVIGAHRDIALSGISQVIDVFPHFGQPSNILLDGVMLSDLSDDEIALVREAYQAEYTIVFYEVSEKDIVEIYSQIIDHPITHSEIESLEAIIEGNMSPIFTIEKHGDLDWTSTGDFNISDNTVVLIRTEDDTPDPDAIKLVQSEDEFVAHGRLIRDWLRDHPNRRQQVINQNLESTNAQRLIDELELRDELNEQIGIDTRTESGTLLDLANANIHTSIKQVGFSETTLKNTYAMTSKVWIVTADTPTGIFTFLLVRQDFNLANSNGFVQDDPGEKALSKYYPSQHWYLKEYSVKNVYRVDGTALGISKAQLLEESPATNQATSQTSTTSLMANISGRVAADTGSMGPSANVAIQGGVSWGTSTTVSKEDVSINNLSLSDNTVLNDASWQFLPRQPEPGGQKGTCKNFGLRNLADLAHTTFTPATAFIVRIDDDFVGKTLQIFTTFGIQLEGSTIEKCGPFFCNCGVRRTLCFNNTWFPTSTHSVRIPYPPEGPLGDPTCSDGVDNDSDGFIDSADASCQ